MNCHREKNTNSSAMARWLVSSLVGESISRETLQCAQLSELESAGSDSEEGIEKELSIESCT
jgi:hypothetical protein